jgi:hypothetical protein
MKQENGPFLRQSNEKPDKNGEIRFSVQAKDERTKDSPEGFRVRIFALVNDCLKKNGEVVLVRGIDLNDGGKLAIIRSAIVEAVQVGNFEDKMVAAE